MFNYYNYSLEPYDLIDIFHFRAHPHYQEEKLPAWDIQALRAFARYVSWLIVHQVAGLDWNSPFSSGRNGPLFWRWFIEEGIRQRHLFKIGDMALQWFFEKILVLGIKIIFQGCIFPTFDRYTLLILIWFPLLLMTILIMFLTPKPKHPRLYAWFQILLSFLTAILRKHEPPLHEGDAM